jgi:thymidine phosphorylase
MSHTSCSSLSLTALNFGLEHHHYIVFINLDCPLSQSLGLRGETRVEVIHKNHSLVATLISLPASLINCGEIGLSESSWTNLGLKKGDKVTIRLSDPLESFSFVRSKLCGHPFTQPALQSIITDISHRKYSDSHLACFITSSIHLTLEEIVFLTKAMVYTGTQITWEHSPIVDLHCIGGVPGNRTTMIVIPIIAAFGLTIPKTSSRAITSPTGTADTMEVLAPVTLTLDQMRHVVDKEKGCIIWGESIGLSPADGVLIAIESILNIECFPLLIASVLSKKKAMGSTHVLIDIPVGPNVKIRSSAEAKAMTSLFNKVGKAMGLSLCIIETDGSQPIGKGIGPALEARDVLSVLRCEKEASSLLRNRSLLLASIILEEWGGVPKGLGLKTAEDLLTSGQALKKFEAICKAQGGTKELIYAPHKEVVVSPLMGTVAKINNSHVAQTAKLAGSPTFPGAGIDLHVSVGSKVEKGQPLFTLYAESPGELKHALHYFLSHPEMIIIEKA